jgi:hypothetical protein
VPAAAVIPSLIAFSYVVAVKKLVAVSSIACHFEKIGVFKSGPLLYATAKNDISSQRWGECSIWQHGTDGTCWGQVK